MLQELPPHLAELLPADVILCHSERSDDATYGLWVFRSPSRQKLTLPDNLSEFQQRRLPAAVLERILDRATPWLQPGEPEDATCSFARWHHGDADYQVREMVTRNGWYATMELFAHGDGPSVAP